MSELDEAGATGAARRLLGTHPLSYGFRAGKLVLDPDPNDGLVRDRMARCHVCEQWSPCDVRILTSVVLAALPAPPGDTPPEVSVTYRDEAGKSWIRDGTQTERELVAEIERLRAPAPPDDLVGALRDILAEHEMYENNAMGPGQPGPMCRRCSQLYPCATAKIADAALASAERPGGESDG